MLAERGFQHLSQVIPPSKRAEFLAEAERLAAHEPDAAHGIRDLLKKSQVVRTALEEGWLKQLVSPGYICVRGILFDKTASANWLVPWHQDLTICVQSPVETQGYGPWSIKHGVAHVQPPIALLEKMVTVRLHLDDAPASNGALRVIPQSHQHGRLDAQQIEQWRTTNEEVACAAIAGDVLLMKPLLLHASSKATSPAHRRVIHLEFAPVSALAPNLQWYEGGI